MSVASFCDWLSETPVSVWLQATGWVIPSLQSIHIMAIAMVMSSVLVLTLSLMGRLGPLNDPATVVRRFMPWIWASLVVLVCTGSVLVVAEPRRDLLNPVFIAKMSLLVIALAFTTVQQTVLKRQVAGHAPTPGAFPVKITAFLACGVWVAIVACGRWIAYAPHG